MLQFLNSVKKTQHEMNEEFKNLQSSNSQMRKKHTLKFAENEKYFNLQNERVRKKISLTTVQSK